MSGVNTPALIGADSPQARDLLTALSNFVKPIVYECMSSDYNCEVLKPINDVGAESVEHHFVNCVKAFIVNTVNECRATESTPVSAANSTHISSSTTLVPGPLNATSRTHAIPPEFREVFKDYVVERIGHDLVRVPTRLLAFDSTGLQIRLIDKREAPSFLAEVIFADLDNNFTVSFLPDLLTSFRHDPTGHFLRGGLGTKTAKVAMAGVRQFIDKYIGYTVLSHTWAKGVTPAEITYQDWATRAQDSPGYAKIRNFCKASAQDHGFRLGWVDTCCINKESSAELDEAIRSMYQWYNQAAICLVYLSETTHLDTMARDPWFTRGWTLQELVAPTVMAVYNTNWIYLDCDQNRVAAIVNISAHEMTRFKSGELSLIPISRRLQMACGRQVTREEDTAYSLMGILDVSISIAYGEGGRRAFTRLIRELITTRRDAMDVFNHGYMYGNHDLIPTGVDVYQYRSKDFDYPSLLQNMIPIKPFLLTHIGLRIHLLLLPGLHAGRFPFNLEEYDPKGSLYGKVWGFNLLDRKFDSRNVQDDRLFFGIVNFSVEDGNVVIQNPVLSIPLSCVKVQRQGNESWDNSGPIYLPNETSPPVFTLKSVQDTFGQKSLITVPETKMAEQGIRRKMLYL